MKKQFPQVLKGAATATATNPMRVGIGGGPKRKQVTLPSLQSLYKLLEDDTCNDTRNTAKQQLKKQKD